MRCLPSSHVPFTLRRAAYWLVLACIALIHPAHGAVSPSASPEVATAAAFPALSQLHRTLFTTRDGAPATIWAIAQDRDGYLWLGGSTGLFRFDGVHFEPMFKGRLPAGTITALFGDSGGNLWIGGLDGKLMRIHNGVIESVERGLKGSTIMSFHQMADGTLWVVTLEHVAHLLHDTWQTAGPAEGFNADRMNVAGTGKDGSYWIFAKHAAYRLRPDATRFERYSRDEGMAAMADLPASVTYPAHGVSADMIVDRFGALWVPTNGSLVRLHTQAHAGKQQLVSETVKPVGADSDLQVTADYSDRQGNVWVASSAGLEQFRATRFVPLTLPQPVYRPTIAAGRDGALWIASNSATPPMRFGDTITVHPELGAHIVCITRAPDGSVWFSGDKGILRYKDGQVSTIPIPGSSAHAGQEGAGLRCQGMIVDAHGSLWVSMLETGVSRWDGQRWISVDTDMAAAIQFAGTRTWLGSSSGNVSAIDNGKTTVYSDKDGLDVGTLGGLYSGHSGLWIVGTNGVMVRVGEKFLRLTGTHNERFEGVSDIVELDNGDVWMLSPQGVYRVPASEVRLALSTPGHAVSYEMFDQADGLQGAIGSRQSDPLEIGGDGRLWVATERGVAWIDPLHIAPATAPPPVTIASINDRDVRFAQDHVPRLEKGTRNIAISYTAATLSMPGRARFRYRLSGVDDDWLAASEQREAHYSNLGPGNYTFEVEASDADGVWAHHATSFAFLIPPEFYQSWWFKGLCGALLLAALWLLYLLRVAHICAQLDARTRERESMARDFHDTILQSFHGLLLHVEVAAQSVPEGSARHKLDKAIGVTNDALTEGREKIGQLRSLAEPLEELPTDIARLAGLFGGIHPMAFSMDVEGELMPLDSSAASDVHAIVRELVINAFRHSRGNNLHVVLHYGRLELNITVTDDGCGIDTLAPTAREPGHWGLQGMQERARRIGGRLIIGAAGSGSGTRATLKIPARFVYARRRWFH